jgi:hypothetical protein
LPERDVPRQQFIAPDRDFVTTVVDEVLSHALSQSGKPLTALGVMDVLASFESVLTSK